MNASEEVKNVSEEVKNVSEEVKDTSEEVKKENRRLCEEYPFLIPRNRWTGQIPQEYDYEYTELDNMPDGWRVAFGEQMCAEIKEELVKLRGLDDYRISQIKEKYGSLRWYANFETDTLWKIISKYEKMSMYTCVECGKAATRVTLGWISPYCDDCCRDEPSKPVDKFWKEW